MRKKQAPLAAGLALGVGLVVLLVAAFSGAPTAGAALPPLAATVAPAATPAPVTQSGDPARDTTTAAVNLQAGYIMDPYLLPVIGKSEKAAADLQKGCNGYVSAAPNVVVNWAGATDQLSFFIYSDADAALVIQQPDGSFLCNDDAGLNTTDPLVKIANPAPGSYKVFAGTAAKDAPALGFLAITQADMDDARLAELDLTSMLAAPGAAQAAGSAAARPTNAADRAAAHLRVRRAPGGLQAGAGFCGRRGRYRGVPDGGQEAGVRRLHQRGAQLQLHLDGQAAGAPAVLRGAAG